jgi:integrase
MSAIFKHAQKYELIPRTTDANPMPWVSASELSDYEAVPVSPEQAFAILDRIEPPLIRCLVILVSATGLRISEALGLRWSDVDWKRGRIHVRWGFVDGRIGDPKSKASRSTVEMHRTLAAVLEAWRKETTFAADTDFLFASERKNGSQPRLGSMISTDYVRPAAIEAKVIEESCPRFGLHNMRHGLATWLVDQGTSPEIVQRMLRWSSTRMLQRYVHPEKKARRAQGEFLKRMNGKRVRGRVQENGSPTRKPV